MSLVDGLVSVIIPVFNRPDLLSEAVDSVLAQNYRPIEVIVVDDGSTDETSQIIDHFATQYPRLVKVVHQRNTGPGHARERGRILARGEYIQYLDSDDLLLPSKLELQVSGLKTNTNCDVAYGKTRYYKVGDTPQDLPLKRTGEKIETMFPSLLKSRWWSTSTPLFRRKVVDKAGPWTNLLNEEDWEYDCRVASQGITLFYTDTFVSDTRDHSGMRMNRGGGTEISKLRDRAMAHKLIFAHALDSGIKTTVPEMKHFSRELFLLARQCGTVGLHNEATDLFNASILSSDSSENSNLEFRIFDKVVSILGWRATGKLSVLLDSVRR